MSENSLKIVQVGTCSLKEFLHFTTNVSQQLLVNKVSYDYSFIISLRECKYMSVNLHCNAN